MKIAFLADVHANLPAFEAALDRAKRWGADEVMLVGDLVGGGPHPAEVVEVARKRNLVALAGANERAIAAGSKDPALAWTAARLDRNATRWLAALSGSRRARWGRFRSLVKHGPIEDSERGQCDLVISAGSHVAGERALADGKRELGLGSVGLPADGPEAAVLLADFDAERFEVARVPFDVAAFERDFRRSKAEWLIVADTRSHNQRGA